MSEWTSATLRLTLCSALAIDVRACDVRRFMTLVRTTCTARAVAVSYTYKGNPWTTITDRGRVVGGWHGERIGVKVEARSLSGRNTEFLRYKGTTAIIIITFRTGVGVGKYICL